MAEPINLRQARKRRQRQEAEKQAAANRLSFGRTRADRAAVALAAEREARALESHRRGSRPPAVPEPDS